MKKIYVAPNLRIVNVNTKNSILIVSGQKIDVKVEGGDGTQLTRQSSGWDLWGDDNDFDVE